MKITNYLIFAFTSLVVLGCATTYTEKDFSSKEKFYDDFNNSAKYKNINITLLNDSSFSVPYGAVIANDSLLTILNIKHNVRLDHNSIKEIKDYYNTDFAHPLHEIILRNGSELKGDNIKILPDSSVEYTIWENVYGKNISLKKVKGVNYKNHWLSIPSGFLIGALSGVAAAYTIISIINKAVKDKDTQIREGGYFILSVPILGALVGTIWGWLNGYTYTYQFNR